MGYWEVQLGGQWKSLGRVVGQACQQAKDRGATQVKFEAHGHQYLIDIPQMVQTNIKSGKNRAVRIRGGHGEGHGGGSDVHVHSTPAPAPAPSAPGAPAPAAVPPPAEEKSSGGIGVLGGGALLAGMAAAGTGIAVAAGVIDIGDITDAATAAGDAIGDVAGDAADAIADAAADVQDLM
jgi:hypothetical protein